MERARSLVPVVLLTTLALFLTVLIGPDPGGAVEPTAPEAVAVVADAPAAPAAGTQADSGGLPAAFIIPFLIIAILFALICPIFPALCQVQAAGLRDRGVISPDQYAQLAARNGF